MSVVTSILFFAASVAAMILFFGQAVLSIKRRIVYYDPNSPPIVFSTRPFAFVTLCSFFVAFGVLFLIFTVLVALELFRAM